jgi:hypothetical protein
MYHYAFVDKKTEEIIDVKYGTEAARKAINERGGKEDINIQPIMLGSQYLSQPKDYRGEKDGKPWLLYLNIYGATTYGPVIIAESSTIHHLLQPGSC